MWIDIVLLIVGFVILIKGADIFVDGASSFAQNFHLSKMLIGLTIVSFGTSAPEFAVSIQSLMSGKGDILLGNVIGSNILNILLILGISSFVHTLSVKNNTVKKELPITVLMTTLFIVLISDRVFDTSTKNTFTRTDGIVLLLFFLVFVYYLVTMMRNKTEEIAEKKWSISKSILYTLFGIGCIVLGSNLVVEHASSIAEYLHVSERLISLTIVALGTSLPELVTSVVATKKGEYDIAIGNVVGSNIFNIGIVIGLPVVLFGGIHNFTIGNLDLIMLFLSILLLLICSWNDQKITKKEGSIMLLLFILYYSYIIIH